MKFKIDKHNLDSISGLGEIARKNKAAQLEIEITDNPDDRPCFSEVLEFVYPLLDYEIYFPVWLVGFPFCAVAPDAVDHIRKGDSKGKKTKDCRKCVFNDNCSGFPKGYLKKNGQEEICPTPDLPEEVMIEVEPRCNFNCRFCFNQISFARNGRALKSFSTAYVKKIIDAVAKSGISIIRFTGGEPLLRKDIFQLLKYAKGKGLEVRLNTNGYLITRQVAKKLSGLVDNVLLPIESYTDKKEAAMTGAADSLKRKIKAIEWLKEEEIPVVRAGTVATKENISDFAQIAGLVFSLPLDEWELYRPIPLDKKTELVPCLINLLADKLIELRRDSDRDVYIANAIPFCAIGNLNKLNAVSKGALYDDGHRRLVVDPRGFLKPHYFLDENIGRPTEILSAWQSDFMKKMRGLEFLPEECRDCPFVFKCRGGSRQAAKTIKGDYSFLDPLAKIKNKNKFVL